MQLTIHVGMRLGGGPHLSRFASDNRAELRQVGVQVDVSPTGGDAAGVDAAIERWRALVDDASAAGTRHLLLSDTRLAAVRPVRGQAKEWVAALQPSGDVQVLALVRRIDDHIATTYVQQVVTGRFKTLSELEAAGARNLNYPALLRFWRNAVSDQDFRAVPAPSGPASAALATSLGDVLGCARDLHLVAPEPLPWQDLSADAVEALRQFNTTLIGNQLDDARSRELRQQATSLLGKWTQDDPPLRLVTDAGLAVRQRYLEAETELAGCMSVGDAERFLADEMRPGSPPDEERSSHLVRRVRQELGIKHVRMAAPVRKNPDRKDQQRLVSRIRQAQELGQDEKAERAARDLRALIAELPEFQLHEAVGPPPPSIPARVLQYWEPWPPPEEMRPWLDSWGDVGFPGGEHLVASFDSGLAIMDEVVGADGVAAWQAAHHPAARSDLLRYAELVARGGWYVDAEHEALVSIPVVLNWPVEHLFVRRSSVHTATGQRLFPNGFIGAVPGSPVLRGILDEACSNVINGRGGSVLEMTGPVLMTRHVSAYLETPSASAVVIPTNVAFNGVLQLVHNDAQYKVSGHWRDQEFGSAADS